MNTKNFAFAPLLVIALGALTMCDAHAQVSALIYNAESEKDNRK